MRNFSFSVLLLIVFPFSFFGQGYYNNENFGNRSLLLSGNVTGSVDDLGLTYYNPGRIGLVENPVFSINAKAYQVSSVDIHQIFGNDEKISDSRFEGVPSMLAGTFNVEKWENHHFAYSFLTKNRSRVDISLTREYLGEELELEDVDRLTRDLKLRNRENEEWFGATWGTKLSENLGIGVSGFVAIYSLSGSYDQRFAILDESGDVDISDNDMKYNQYSYGLFWKVGLAYKLGKFDLGLNIDLPYLEVISSGSFRYQKYLAWDETITDVYEYVNYRDLSADRKEPLSVSFGAGFPIGKHKLHFRSSWHNSVDEYDRLVIPDPVDLDKTFSFTESLSSVVNFGLGGEFVLSQRLNLFGSFATDFSPVESNATLFDLIKEGEHDVNLDADFFHYGFGIEMKLKKAHLVLGTTYSHGSSSVIDNVEVPEPDLTTSLIGHDSKVGISRWRFIVGFEFPLFGYDLEFK